MRSTKTRRINEAKIRQEKFDVLTLPERVKKLDKMFGKGVGAVKERAKIAKQIEKQKQPKEVIIEPILIPTIFPVIEKLKKKAKERRKEDKSLKHKNKE